MLVCLNFLVRNRIVPLYLYRDCFCRFSQVEDPRKALFLYGNKASQLVKEAMMDLQRLKGVGQFCTQLNLFLMCDYFEYRILYCTQDNADETLLILFFVCLFADRFIEVYQEKQ